MDKIIVKIEVLGIRQHRVHNIRVNASEGRLEIQVQVHNEKASSCFQHILGRILPKHILLSWWKPADKCMQCTDVVLRLSHHSSIHSELLPRQTQSEPLHNRQVAENQNCKDNEISPSLNRYPGRL